MNRTTLLERPAPAEGALPAALPGRRPTLAPSLAWVFAGVFALFGWAAGIGRLTDNSFFWHLATGRYILDHGIPHGDVFSYTAQGTHWVAQSWLAEVTYGALDRAFGAWGIRVFAGCVGLLIGTLTYRLALRLCRDRVVAAAVGVAALSGIYTLWSERPLLIGVLAVLAVVWVVEVPDSWAGRHATVVLPVLFWVWANVHGSFALGFLFVGLHLVGRWLDGAPPWRDRERTLVIGSAVAFLVTFANPYGADLVTFPVALLSRGDILKHIVEWRSPDFRQPSGMALGLWLLVFVVSLARGRHRPSRRDLVVTIPFLLLACWALRNVALAPLVALPVVARVWARDEERVDTTSGAIRWTFVGLLVFLALAIGMRGAAEPDFALASYSTKAMDYVAQHDLLGSRLLTTDADAGYVILAYSPEQRVFIDDRYDMYPTPLIYDYFELANAGPRWSKILDRYDVEVVLWDPSSPLASLLDQSSDWERVHRDKRGAVWVRA